MCFEKRCLIKFECTRQQFKYILGKVQSIDKNLSDVPKSETFVYFTKITTVTWSINKIIFVCSIAFLTSIYIICSSFKMLTPLLICAFTIFLSPYVMKVGIMNYYFKNYFTLLCHCRNVPLSKSLCSRTKSSHRKNLCIEQFQKTKKDLAKKSKKNQRKFPFSILSALCVAS